MARFGTVKLCTVGDPLPHCSGKRKALPFPQGRRAWTFVGILQMEQSVVKVGLAVPSESERATCMTSIHKISSRGSCLCCCGIFLVWLRERHSMCVGTRRSCRFLLALSLANPAVTECGILYLFTARDVPELNFGCWLTQACPDSQG
jgi:hypothetical protein